MFFRVQVGLHWDCSDGLVAPPPMSSSSVYAMDWSDPKGTCWTPWVDTREPLKCWSIPFSSDVRTYFVPCWCSRFNRCLLSYRYSLVKSFKWTRLNPSEITQDAIRPNMLFFFFFWWGNSLTIHICCSHENVWLLEITGSQDTTLVLTTHHSTTFKYRTTCW